MTTSLDDLFATVHHHPAIHDRHTWLGDDPTSHRWRASWAGTDDVTNIELRPVPVVKLTRAGAWIDPHGYITRALDPDSTLQAIPHFTPAGKRWVGNGSGSAWAKPTRDEALRSLAIRLDRWAIQVARQLTQVRAAIATARELLPEHHHWSTSAELRLPREQLDPAEIEAWLKRKYQGEATTSISFDELAEAIARFYRNRF